MNISEVSVGMRVREVEDNWIGVVLEILTAEQADKLLEGSLGDVRFEAPFVVRCKHEPGSGGGEYGFIVPPSCLEAAPLNG